MSAVALGQRARFRSGDVIVKDIKEVARNVEVLP